ncbi:C-GCAxxG-C-C family protein [Porcipelethomonas sp.]|uniref:C-GCAxxG-C-C family protein n=1 Tax=Porcipelethomonas sp. TaxID=2981675 RepID=UPI003EF16388
MNKAEKAKDLFKKGYNCSQSVLGAFAEDLGMDFDTAMKLSSSFGGGMGRMREVCGAVSGMFMAAGLKYGYCSPDDRTGKTEHYKRIQELAEKFKEKNHYIVCRQLLGIDGNDTSHVPSERTAEYYKKRPCAELVGDAAEILEEYFKNNE